MNVQGWHLKQLNELGTIFSGSTPSTTNRIFWNGDIVWITPNDLSQLNTPYLTNSAKKITPQGLKNCSAQLLPINSIVLSSRAPIGYIAINTVECCTNQGCKSFVLKREYNPEFVYYNLKFNINKIKNLGEGTTFAEISKRALAKVEMLFLENISEQEKIAEVLSTVDRAIAQTEALIAKQQRIKTGLMQDLLTKGIDENGNIRSEETHEFKDSAIGRIPVEWEVVPLSRCTQRVVVGLASSTTHAYRDNGVPLIRNQNIRRGFFEDQEMLFLDPDFVKLFPNKVARENDVLTVRTGANVGDTALVPGKYINCPTFTTLITSTKSNILDPNYLVWYLATSLGKLELNRILVGAGKENLNAGQFINFRIFIPSIKEQNIIVKQMNCLQARIEDEKNQLTKLKKEKTGLMQDLLTGKVRVTPLIENSGGTDP